MRLQRRARHPVQAILIGLLCAAGCSVDHRGLYTLTASTTAAGGSGGGRADASVGKGDGAPGSGGAPVIPQGTGGVLAESGGRSGSGGVSTGTGGGAPSASGGGPVAEGGRAASTGGNGAGGQGGTAGQRASGGQGGAPVVVVPPTCNAITCPTGCCMAGVCRTGRSNQRCGTAGAACATCSACAQCSDTGTCALDPSARWDVICSSAILLPTMPQNTNGAWDTDTVGVGALPDPFCEFTADGGRQGRATTTLMNTLTPVWDEPIPPPNGNLTEDFLVSQPWQVTVSDDDFGVTTDDLACSISPQLTAADFAAGTVDLPATRRCLGVTIKLVCAE